MIWDYPKELGLSDSQAKQIKSLFAQLQKELGTLQKKMVANEMQIRGLIAEEAPLDEIKAKVRKVSDIQVDARMLDIGFSRKINALLKPEQIERWRAIQAKTRFSPKQEAGGK